MERICFTSQDIPDLLQNHVIPEEGQTGVGIRIHSLPASIKEVLGFRRVLICSVWTFLFKDKRRFKSRIRSFGRNGEISFNLSPAKERVGGYFAGIPLITQYRVVAIIDFSSVAGFNGVGSMRQSMLSNKTSVT